MQLSTVVDKCRNRYCRWRIANCVEAYIANSVSDGVKSKTAVALPVGPKRVPTVVHIGAVARNISLVCPRIDRGAIVAGSACAFSWAPSGVGRHHFHLLELLVELRIQLG